MAKTSGQPHANNTDQSTQKAPAKKTCKSIMKAAVQKTSKSSKSAPEQTLSKCSENVPEHSILRLRCQSRDLVELIEGFSDNQKKAIEKIGFGGLLHLKVKDTPHIAVPLFLKAFDNNAHMFIASETCKYLLTKHDVYDCFMLPLGPKELPLVPTARQTGSQDEEFTQLKQSWRQRYEITDSSKAIPLGRLEDDLKATTTSVKDFKRLFVLYAMGKYLCPTSNGGVDLKLVKAVKNVKGIKNYDWCSYVLNGMVNAASDSRKPKPPRFTLGCIHFIMICYFHRFNFRGVALPSDIPLIMHWDDKNFKKRAEAELSSGQLGIPPMSDVLFPRCLHSNTADVNIVNDPSQPPVAIQKKDAVDSSLRSSPSAAHSSEKKFITIELPVGVDDDLQLKAKSIDDVHYLYLMSQRNAIVFHEWYLKTTSEIKRLTKVEHTDVTLQDPGQPTTESQAFFEDDAIQHYFDEVTKLSKFMKDAAAKAPIFQLASSTGENVVQQHILVDHNVDPITCVLDEIRAEHGDASQLHDNLDDIQADYVNVSPIHDTTDHVETDHGNGFSTVGHDQLIDTGHKSPPNFYVPACPTVHHPFLLHSETPVSSMLLVPENLGCSVDCGAPDEKRLVVSSFLSLSRSLFATVFSLRLDVMDYIFDDPESSNQLECLVHYHEPLLITRDEMSSLLPGQQLGGSVIDCWSILINQLMHERHVAIPSSRYYFGLSHSEFTRHAWDEQKLGKQVDVSKDVFQAWDCWLDYDKKAAKIEADLVFIPTLTGIEDHYICICINFVTKQIEYLDNRSYEGEFEESPYFGLVRIEADLMGQYLHNKGIERGKSVMEFKIVNVDFHWQGNGVSNNDCGVYVMIHMLLYGGLKFVCNLVTQEAVNLCRAEIAATLVLSDINRARSDVLKSVDEFNTRKATMPMTFETPKTTKRKSKTSDNNDSAKRTRTIEPTAPNTGPLPISAHIPTGKSLSALKSRSRGKGDGLGCSIDCGVSCKDTLVVSRFLRGNQQMIQMIPDLRKHVVDWCFLDDYNLSNTEMVAYYTKLAYLTRDDILSMHPTSLMYSQVLECWSMLLNKIESEESQDPKMAFFGIRHSDAVMKLLQFNVENSTAPDSVYDDLFMCWDSYIADCGKTFNKEAKYIFVPLNMDSHYFCICINFLSMTVDVLDNVYISTKSSFERSKLYEASKLLAGCVSDYYSSKLSDINLPTEIRHVKFNWQHPIPNDKESGCFTMMCMLMYEGSPFTHEDLERKTQRRFLVMQMAACLLLADINKRRDKILGHVNQFIVTKPKIWAHLKPKRQLEDKIKPKKSKTN